MYKVWQAVVPIKEFSIYSLRTSPSLKFLAFRKLDSPEDCYSAIVELYENSTAIQVRERLPGFSNAEINPADISSINIKDYPFFAGYLQGSVFAKSFSEFAKPKPRKRAKKLSVTVKNSVSGLTCSVCNDLTGLSDASMVQCNNNSHVHATCSSCKSYFIVDFEEDPLPVPHQITINCERVY